MKHGIHSPLIESKGSAGSTGPEGSGFRVQGSGFRVQGSGFRVQGSGFRVQGSGLWWRLRRKYLWGDARKSANGRFPSYRQPSPLGEGACVDTPSFLWKEVPQRGGGWKGKAVFLYHSLPKWGRGSVGADRAQAACKRAVLKSSSH